MGKADPEDLPYEVPVGGSEAAFHRVNEVDPLTCPKCQGRMRIIAFIDDEDVTRLPRLSRT